MLSAEWMTRLASLDCGEGVAGPPLSADDVWELDSWVDSSASKLVMAEDCLAFVLCLRVDCGLLASTKAFKWLGER